MRKFLAIALVFSLAYMPLLDATAAAAPALARPAAAARQDDSGYEPYSDDQLDNLLAPIALYPDPLLAQVLLAATFPDQIDAAARFVRAYGPNGVDNQYWDVSVKAVAHYPTVLDMMADKLDWTAALGQAYVYQSTDVMSSVQRLRSLARAQGNLVTNAQQQVIVDSGYIEIWPVHPQYIYVPVYDPYIVYHRRWPGYGSLFITFGIGLLIGAWLNHDCDWRHRRVYYTGWSGPGWIARSRPYVRINYVYVNNRYTNVYVNRDVGRRNINYYNLNRYNSIHKDSNFDNRARNRNNYQPNPRVNNRVIQRNIDTGNPQLDRYRGHQQQGAPAPPGQRPPQQPAVRPAPEQPVRPAPPVQPTVPSGARPRPQPQPRQQPQPQPRTQPSPGVQTPPQPRQQQQPQPQPRVQTPPQAQPQRQSQARPQWQQQQPGAFNRGDGGFSPNQASRRGQASRSQAQQPQRTPPSRPSAPKSAPQSSPKRSQPQRSAPAQRSQGRSK